jgi:prenylcysteine alpha-carboxyl methylesterase
MRYEALSFQVTLILFGYMQDPLRGGKDELFEHIVAEIHANDREALAKDAMAPPRRRLVPEFLLQMAREISPF